MLKTITQHNEEMRKKFEKKRDLIFKTGVECPECKVELIYIDPYTVLTSFPPRKAVYCPNCRHEATIIVED